MSMRPVCRQRKTQGSTVNTTVRNQNSFTQNTGTTMVKRGQNMIIGLPKYKKAKVKHNCDFSRGGEKETWKSTVGEKRKLDSQLIQIAQLCFQLLLMPDNWFRGEESTAQSGRWTPTVLVVLHGPACPATPTLPFRPHIGPLVLVLGQPQFIQRDYVTLACASNLVWQLFLRCCICLIRPSPAEKQLNNHRSIISSIAITRGSPKIHKLTGIHWQKWTESLKIRWEKLNSTAHPRTGGYFQHIMFPKQIFQQCQVPCFLNARYSLESYTLHDREPWIMLHIKFTGGKHAGDLRANLTEWHHILNVKQGKKIEIFWLWAVKQGIGFDIC